MIRIQLFRTIAVLWAFFGPESFGRWLGTIAHVFLKTAGF